MFIPLVPVSEIFGTLFEALFLEETLRERIPSQERIPSRHRKEHEHRGPAGPIVFLWSRKLCGIRASGGFYVRSLFPQFEVSSLCITLRPRPARPFQNLIVHENLVLPREKPLWGELPFLRSVVFWFILNLFQHGDHWWHFGGGYPNLDYSVVVRVPNMLILEVQTATRPSF